MKEPGMPVQVDPQGCGCTECLTGEYVPLEDATPKQIRNLIFGTLADASGETFVVTTGYPRRRMVRGENSGLEWEW